VITRAAFLGGAQHLTPSADFDIVTRAGRAITISASVGLSGLLPDAREFPQTGGPVAYILNIGSNAVDLEDADNGSIATVGVNEAAEVHLVGNATAAGGWIVGVKPILS
jgi:hypothetical protein